MFRLQDLQPKLAGDHPRRLSWIGAAAAGAIAWLSATMAPAAAIRVGIIGDQTGSTDLDQSYAVLRDAVGRLRSLPLNLVLHTGDLIESTQTPEQIMARFKTAVGVLGGLGAPWYLTAGDHDVNPPAWQPNSPDRSREKLFQSLYSAINPAVRSRLYYSFDVKGSDGKTYHFISLYALEHLDADPRWGDVFFAQLSAAQQQWLYRDLDTHRDAAGIVVWLHQPLWYNWSSWEPVHRLLASYPVAAVVAGHFHYNQWDGVIDGIDYRVVGATGGTLAGAWSGLAKIASPWAGGAQHVTVMTLDRRQVSFQMLPLSGSEPVGFTPRYDMDRVQAISYILGDLSGFWSVNPVWLVNGQPVSSCETMTPASLKLSRVGNPIDIPITLRVSLSSDAVRVASSQYAATVCGPDSPPGSCSLAANANVSASNTSAAQLSSYNPIDVWQATLAGTGRAGGQATLTVSCFYVSPFSNLPLGMSASVVTTIAACPPAARTPPERMRELDEHLKHEQQWVPLASGLVPGRPMVEISGGPGCGRILAKADDVKVEGGRRLLRVGAEVKLLEQPQGTPPERVLVPAGARDCRSVLCMPVFPNQPLGNLICCNTGEVLGRCMGAWPCRDIPAVPPKQ